MFENKWIDLYSGQTQTLFDVAELLTMNFKKLFRIDTTSTLLTCDTVKVLK